MFEEIVASGIEVLYFHHLSSYRIDAKCRLCSKKDFPNGCFTRQTKRRQKDAKIPESCFFPSLKYVNLTWLLFAVHSLIDRFVLWKRTLLFLLPQCGAKHLYLALW